jgi:DegV family protein with EDD domain
MSVKIITDTSCDLPVELLVENKIDMIPLKVTFADGQTYLDRWEISPSQFIARMQKEPKLPKTAAPDPATFISNFDKGLNEADEVLFVGISSGLSSVCQTALLAKNIIDNENVYVFDSLAASLGTGFAAINASRLARQGMNAAAIVDELSRRRAAREILFILDTLDNIVKGGRLNPVQGMAGNFLSIKPMLRGNAEGVPEVVQKIRGRNHALQRLIDMVGETAGASAMDRVIGVSHVSCLEDAVKLAQALQEKYHPREEIIIAEIGATIGTYTGAGALMVNVY